MRRPAKEQHEKSQQKRQHETKDEHEKSQKRHQHEVKDIGEVVNSTSLLALQTGERSIKYFTDLVEGTGIDESFDCNYINNKSAQHYILLGPMDSGSNLIHQLMYAAWPSQVCMESHRFVWKHALTGVQDIYDFMLKNMTRDDFGNSVLLHTVRAPLSQFASWSKQAYELEECVSRAVQYWDQPCIAAMGPYHPIDGPVNFVGGTKPTLYNSTMEIYNRYLQQLAKFSDGGWFKAVVPVAYEDMILSPGRVVNDIVKHFDGLGEVNDEDLKDAMGEPSKVGAETSDAALQKLTDKTYLQHFSTDDMDKVCNGLTKALVEQYKAGNYLEPSRQVSYWDDCEHRV